MHKKKTSFELKSTHLPVLTFALKSTDINLLEEELTSQFGKQSDYFENEPAILDLAAINSEELNLTNILDVLKRYQLRPFAASHATSQSIEALAKQAGLLVFPDLENANNKQETENKPSAHALTLFVDKPVRSGQQIYARNSDLILTSPVSFGAEVIADGNIHVYAPLRGRAIAGAQGDTNARIFTTCFEPALYSIAGVFQTTEQKLPDTVLGKPAMVHLENNNLIVSPL